MAKEININFQQLVKSDLLVILINECKKSGFTAFGLYRIQVNTLLTIFAIVISYSVILIQTSYWMQWIKF